VFSPADYELAARILGLPVPRTPAECAAAAPLTASVLRNYHRAAPPMPGFEEEGINTSATRSLNAYPDVRQPEARRQMQHRLQAGIQNTDDQAELAELFQVIMNDPALLQQFMDFVQNTQQNSDDGAEYLSRQRPAEFDMPNYGGQYSMLNAPTNSTIPASVAYQALG